LFILLVHPKQGEEIMDSKNVQQMILDTFEMLPGDDLEYVEGVSEIDSITTFEENHLLTNDNGLVIKMNDGSEFLITITQSR
jgi:hypothetical protein